MKRLGILGAGHVGDAVAYSAAMRGIAEELWINDCDEDRAISVVTDVNDARSFYPHSVSAHLASLEDLARCDLIVVCLGKIPLTGDRLDELSYSKPRIEACIPAICNAGFKGFFVVISNPVDIITQLVQKLSGFDPKRVIGTGTQLDTCRFVVQLAERFKVNPKSIEGYVLGEHGNSQFPVWSQSKIGHEPIAEYCSKRGIVLSSEDKEQLAKDTAYRGWLIFKGKKCTQFGIANTSLNIVSAIDRDSKEILLASTLLEGEYGLSDIYLSTPCLIGKDGIEERYELALDADEQAKLDSSAALLKKTMQDWDI